MNEKVYDTIGIYLSLLFILIFVGLMIYLIIRVEQIYKSLVTIAEAQIGNVVTTVGNIVSDITNVINKKEDS